MAFDKYFGFDTTQKQTLQKLIDEAVAQAIGGAAVPNATTSVAGKVKQAAATSDFAGEDAAALVVELNALLGKLRTAGLVASS